MTWIKQNKFLAGFIAVMVIGVGALGFLMLSAKGQYEEVRSDYEAKTSELNRLENLKPYPEAGNLKQFEVQKKDHAEAIAAFQKNLTATEIPVEPLSPEQFQDRLRESVSRVVAKANEKGAKLEKFYMGFDRYQTEPPRPEAAPLLGRQLKALELVLMQMLDVGIVSLDKLEREPLAEEEGKSKKAGETAGKAPAPGKGGSATKDLLDAHPVRIDFTTDQSRFRTILNGIVSNKTQFYIPRVVEVTNEKDVAPPKLDPGAAVAAATPPPPAIDPATGQPIPAAPGTPPPRPAEDLKLVFGAERVSVRLLLEIIDFAEAPNATTAAK